jgi:peptidoglycan/xylan/chitin deacetylase (PgdA/CDA1 family)
VRWSSAYPRDGNTIRNIARLGRIHSIFQRNGARPTYLVDYPVAADTQACAILKTFAAHGAAEIGAHLHPWCNPPFDRVDAAGRAATFPHNLPRHLQESKLRALIDAIYAGTGVRPTSYRAGRWGFNHTSVPVLEKLGMLVDTSVTPLWWDDSERGPLFASAPQHPYRLSCTDVCSPETAPWLRCPRAA